MPEQPGCCSVAGVAGRADIYGTLQVSILVDEGIRCDRRNSHRVQHTCQKAREIVHLLYPYLFCVTLEAVRTGLNKAAPDLCSPFSEKRTLALA